MTNFNFSRKEAAEKLGICQQTLSRWKMAGYLVYNKHYIILGLQKLKFDVDAIRETMQVPPALRKKTSKIY